MTMEEKKAHFSSQTSATDVLIDRDVSNHLDESRKHGRSIVAFLRSFLWIDLGLDDENSAKPSTIQWHLEKFSQTQSKPVKTR